MAKKAAPAATRRRRGRPTDWQWSDDLMQDICDHLSTGKSLIDIGKLQGYPSSDSMYRQMARDPEFAARCARAREAGQDHEADACVQMADMATNEDREVVKLRIETRKWRAAQLAPKRYGTHQQIELSGQVQHTVRPELPWESLSPETRALVMEELEAERARLAAPVDIEVEDD